MLGPNEKTEHDSQTQYVPDPSPNNHPDDAPFDPDGGEGWGSPAGDGGAGFDR